MLPVGCSKSSIVIQQKPIFEEDKEFVFSQSLIKKMDSYQIAVLLLEESIQKVFKQFHKDEVDLQSRYLSAWIASEAFITIKDEDYLKKLSYLGMLKDRDILYKAFNSRAKLPQ